MTNRNDAGHAMSANDARRLTEQIKAGVEAVWHLIEQAYTTRAWAALGYNSWDDYCTNEFSTCRLRLPREERQEVVASLRESGLSIRAIAAATGDSYGTIQNELASGGQNRSPAPITGTDGKTYKPKPRPERETDDSPETLEALREQVEASLTPVHKFADLAGMYATVAKWRSETARMAEVIPTLNWDNEGRVNLTAKIDAHIEALGVVKQLIARPTDWDSALRDIS